MNLLSRAAVLFLGLAVPLTCASASTPSRFTPLEGIVSTPRDIRILHAFSACAVRHQFGRDRGRAVLAMDPTTEEYRQAILAQAGRSSHCLPGNGSRMRFRALPFAGGMAEALLVSDRSLGDLAARVAFNPSLPAFRAHDELEVMSVCVVRAAPGEVAALFATQPASDAENAALRAIMPRAGQCLTAGTRLRVNALSMRSMLALAAWRLDQHNHVATASTR
ncbi:MAG TPA: hypothetical protein VIT38_04195 [Allosphingosinicella sp.]|jgi:hypothetical protein